MTPTETPTAPTRLLDDFPEATHDEWRAAAEALLKGAPFEKRLLTETYEGLTLRPIHEASVLDGVPHLHGMPGRAPYLRGGRVDGYLSGGWEVAQELTEVTPAGFNAAALHDLERGQTALTVVLDRATLCGVDPDEARPGDVGLYGLSVASVDDLDRALLGVDLTTVPVYLQAPSAAVPLLALFVAVARRRQLDLHTLVGGVEMDPIGALATEGRYLRSLPGAYDRMAQAVAWAGEHAPHLSTVTVHGNVWAEGGAHAVQELAFTAATTSEYLRELSQRGVEPEVAAPRLRLSLSVGSNLFMEVAKLRAARLLHARIVQAFGASEAAQRLRIHARTARFNRSVLDPYVNLLRGTTAAFSAVMAGVDSLHVGCWDELMGTPDAQSRRMARNTQLVLREEAHLTGVIDPAGGSWYVEKLTDRVARAAWELFQDIEGRGGMAAALAEGYPQEQIAATLDARRARSARRSDVQVGVNMYADAAETPAPPLHVDAEEVEEVAAQRAQEIAAHRTALEDREATRVMELLAAVLDAGEGDGDVIEALVAAAGAGASLGELARTLRRGDETVTRVQPVTPLRQAEPFEAIRRRVAAQVEGGGERPRVWLAKLGPVAQHRARSEFTTGFMEVGGFAVEGAGGVESPEAAGRAAAASGAPVVAICSTDASYPDAVPPLIEALRAEAPDVVVLVAGRPQEQVAALEAAGVDDFVHLGANAVALHTRLLDRLGVAP